LPEDHVGDKIDPCAEFSNYQEMTVLEIEKRKVTNEEKQAIENDLKYVMMDEKDEVYA